MTMLDDLIQMPAPPRGDATAAALAVDLLWRVHFCL